MSERERGLAAARGGPESTTTRRTVLEEIASGTRFRFGSNWRAFLGCVDEPVIRAAERSLRDWLEPPPIAGRSFLDVGSGSGLFSLAAARLGARVRAFDPDPDSVACAEELCRRYAAGAWTVDNASILDDDYLGRLGTFEIVYAWGVLHHTGEMWRAFENACGLVRSGGCLFVSLYNDQGRASRRWLRVKRLWNRAPWLRPAVMLYVLARLEAPGLLRRLARARNPLPVERWRAHRERRGMSMWRDHVDWAGGLPYEVARPQDVLSRGRALGFSLLRMNLTRDHGANEYLLRRD